MRRRNLTSEEFQKVIRLRQSGVSWMKIQLETSIDRRTAKRAYEDWERNQSKEELKAARKDVAAEEFRNHLHSLIKLAESLLNSLVVPSSPNTTTSAEEVLLDLWRRNIVGEYGAYGLSDRKPETNWILHQNLILFKSLRDHTQEKDWQYFYAWGNSWDLCIKVLANLREEAHKTLLNILNQKSGLKEKIARESRSRDLIRRMENGTLYVVWEHIIDSESDPQFPFIQTTSLGNGPSEVIFGQHNFDVGLKFAKVDLADQVTKVCKWAANNLYVGRENDIIKSLINSVIVMRKSIEELSKILNPLKLRPLILNTRCELCPA